VKFGTHTELRTKTLITYNIGEQQLGDNHAAKPDKVDLLSCQRDVSHFLVRRLTWALAVVHARPSCADGRLFVEQSERSMASDQTPHGTAPQLSTASYDVRLLLLSFNLFTSPDAF